ncbi:MAG TPA: MFS transporter, partial [Bryobacteraceae bacterium]|nr:MFS transporter [Bryobacteraceae bacterium]
MRTGTPLVKGAPPATAAPSSAGRYRWRVCAALFFVTTLIYLDRQVLGVLAPELQRLIGWNEIQYGNIVTAFQAAYALGLLLAGRFIDRVGTRLGYSIAIALWTSATLGQSLARTVLAFAIARFVLGLAEAPNFPAAIKTVAEWFPRRERALATGIFNSGANIGAVVAPLTAPWIAVHLGWPWAFVFMSAIGVVWIAVWARTYRRPEQHPRLAASELAFIQSEPAEVSAPVPWRKLLPHRQTWAFLIGKFLTDPVWWFFLYWLPKFLNARYGLALTGLGWPLVFVYTMSMAGSIAGGWLSARLLARGWSLNAARKTAMLACALTVIPIVFAAAARSFWVSVALVGLAAAAHQGWSANLFTMTSDMFPKRAVGSVVGIGGFGGALSSMFSATFTGLVLQVTGNYFPMFLLAGSAYLLALLMIQLLVPQLSPAKLDE